MILSNNLEEAMERFETELKLRGFSDATIRTYKMQVAQFLEFVKQNKGKLSSQKSLLAPGSGAISLVNIGKKDLKAFIAHLISDKKKAPSSINLALSALRFFFIEVNKQNIFDGVKSMKTPKKIPTVLSKDEIRRLLDAVKNPKHKLLFMLLYGSGLRVGEAVNLKVDDLDLMDKTGTVRAGKGKKDRNIILSDAMIVVLNEFLLKRAEKGVESEYIFHGATSDNEGKGQREGHITTRQAQRLVKQYAKKAGIKKRIFCHALRSSFATHLLETGTDIRVIQELLGHSNLATTERYTKVSKEQIRKVRSPFDNL